MRLARLALLGTSALFALACGASAEPPAEHAPSIVIAAPAATPEPMPALDEPEAATSQAEEPPAPVEEEARAPAPSPWLAGPTKPDTIVLRGGELVLPDPILFLTGKPELSPASDKPLDAVAAFLSAKPEITMLRIEGHTDSRGSADANLALSGKRALAVAKALVARGVDCRRLLPVTFGETKPIADNTTAEGRAQNRRMTLVIAALKGKPVGGMPLDGGGKMSGDPCRSP